MQSPNPLYFTTTEHGIASGIRRRLGFAVGLILLGLSLAMPTVEARAAASDSAQKGTLEGLQVALTDLAKRLGCQPLVNPGSFEDLLQALGDCYAEHGTPPNPTPELREGIKRDVFRSLDEIHNPQAGISAQTLAAFDDLLFQILADVIE